MIMFDFKVSKNFHCDIGGFYKYRPFSDGIDFINFNIAFDRFIADHKPAFRLWLGILNFSIIDFEVYNIHHVKEKK